MVDVFDSQTRSRLMSGIRTKNTKPETVAQLESLAMNVLSFRFDSIKASMTLMSSFHFHLAFRIAVSHEWVTLLKTT